MYWLRLSRVNWLKEGDANTTFFHRTTLQRRRENKLLKLKAEDGLWVEGDRHISCLVDDYFKSLFTLVGHKDWGDILDCIQPLVSKLMNNDLTKPMEVEEIKVAVTQMGGLNAPGPDGFQGIFYQSYWDIILNEVNGLVKDFMG